MQRSAKQFSPGPAKPPDLPLPNIMKLTSPRAVPRVFSQGSQRLALFRVATFLAACGEELPTDSVVAAAPAVRVQVFEGQDSPERDDFVIRVESAVGLCTATLIAPTVLLTARHCVSHLTVTPFDCSPEGSEIPEGAVSWNEDVALDTFRFFVGPSVPNGAQASTARAVGIRHLERAGYCGVDVGLIGIDVPLEVPAFAAMSDQKVSPDDVLSLVGWGRTDSASTTTVRQRRDDIPVTGVGPAETGLVAPSLAPSEVSFGASACQGDSGGPFLTSDNRVVGVVSRGASCETGPVVSVLLEPHRDWIEGATNELEALASPAGQGGAGGGAGDAETPEEPAGCALAGAPDRPGSTGGLWVPCAIGLWLALRGRGERRR